MISATLKGAENLAKVLGAESKRQEKSLQTAIRVEAFRLMRILKKEIRSGIPGSRRFAPLTYIARRWGGGKRLRPDKPLQRLALAVRYHVLRKKPYELHLGWTGPKVSKSWKRIAKKHQEGFTSDVTLARRRSLMRQAAGLMPRAAGRKYLFLKKETRKFKTPARAILVPFWARHQKDVMPNIRRNYKRKLAGKRI